MLHIKHVIIKKYISEHIKHILQLYAGYVNIQCANTSSLSSNPEVMISFCPLL